MPAITPNVSFEHIAREWRCKWSEGEDKASLTKAQDVFTAKLESIKKVPGVVNVQRVVCGGCHDFKVETKLKAEDFAKWEASGFAPEGELLSAWKDIPGVSAVETQTFTLEEM